MVGSERMRRLRREGLSPPTVPPVRREGRLRRVRPGFTSGTPSAGATVSLPVVGGVPSGSLAA